MPIIEIATFEASDAFITDPSLIKGFLDALVASAGGLISVFHGIQVQDKRTAYIVVAWESIEHHEKIRASPEHPRLAAQLKPCIHLREGLPPVTIRHVEFNGDHTMAVSAPITEVTFAKLKGGESKEGLIAAFLGLSKIVETTPGAYPLSAFGETREEPGNFYAVVGWDSLEAHMKAASGENPALVAAVGSLLTLVGATVVDVKFTKHQVDSE